MSKFLPSQTLARRNQCGVALIIELIMLMVLTMIAVVAMRTTTLDLKMSTNQTLLKRTFQISETARSRIADVLDSHTFYRGWPIANSGIVPASSGFVLPTEIQIYPNPAAPPAHLDLYLENNADHWDLRPEFADLRLRVDADSDSKYESWSDLFADVFISRITAVAAPGSDTSQVTGYEGLGSGAAGAGSHLYYRIIARAVGTGANQSTTEAHYRYVVTN